MARVTTALAASITLGLCATLATDRAWAQQPASRPATEKAEKAAPEAKAKPARKPKGGEAAEKGEGGAPKKADAGDVQRSLAAAQRSLDTSKPDIAIGQIDALIAKGGLDARSMARALSIRGQAHRRQGRPVQAIADLQSALYLRNGLSESERAVALEARATAYREAGLGEAPGIGGGPTRTAAAAKGAATAQPQPATTSPVATAAVPTRAIPSGDASASAPAPAAEAAGSGGIGGFFSNLFGGGTQAQSPAPQPPAAAPPSAPAVSSWSEPAKSEPKQKAPARVAAATVEPRAARPDTPAVAAPAAAAPAAAQAAATPASPPGGRVMLRLAAQKSEGEAQALARRIKSENPEVAQASHRVEEVVFGGMGTFYRANVGPVADIANARRLCAAIRAKGIDCEAVQR